MPTAKMIMAVSTQLWEMQRFRCVTASLCTIFSLDKVQLSLSSEQSLHCIITIYSFSDIRVVKGGRSLTRTIKILTHITSSAEKLRLKRHVRYNGQMVTLRAFDIKMSQVAFTHFCRQTDNKCPLLTRLGGGNAQRGQCPLFVPFFLFEGFPY